MRIAYICTDPGIPVFGCKGASIHVQEIIRSLKWLGAQVELFASRTEGTASPGLEDVILHSLPSVGRGEGVYREQMALAANAGLRAALQQAGCFDLVYERYSLWSYAGMDYARVTHTPGVLEVNAPLIQEQAKHRGLVHRAEAEQVAERVFTAADVLLAVSGEVANYLLTYRGVDQSRVHVVPNGVDPHRFLPDLSPAYPHTANEFIVGFVGTLKSWHGLDILVEAFATFHSRQPGSRLLIVGNGTQREELQMNVTARELTHAVVFIGAVAHDRVPAYLASMDTVVAPYPDLPHFYFSPLKIYEYMASGRAVIASRIGQISDLIEDGTTGLLCPPGDAVALAASLERLHGDSDLRFRLGAAARKAVMQHHTWDAVARRIVDLTRVDTNAGLKLKSNG